MKSTLERIVFNTKENRLLTIIMAALLLGFAWQIRGSGTSDPSVVAVLFLLFLSINYSPRKKFNLFIFGLIALSFNLLRTGWGTFIPQAGFPGVIPGYLPPDVTIAVPWWYGYFWLFIVGISWMGIPSLLFGGYFFTKKSYSWKDVLAIIAIFLGFRFLFTFVVEPMIPVLAPEYYKEIYLTGISERSYGSMLGNMSTALAIIPVLLYILFFKKDRDFFKHALIAMFIFAFALSIANIWRPVSMVTGVAKYQGWSMWEYTTGFIFGGLIFWYYSRLSPKELKETDLPTDLKYEKWNPILRFLLLAFSFYRLVLYGIGEGLEGAIRKSLSPFGIENTPSGDTLKLIIGSIGILVYWFYYNKKIGVQFSQKSKQEKSLIALMILLLLHYLMFATHHLIEENLFAWQKDNIAVWMNTLSFVIVEIYLVWIYLGLNKNEAKPKLI